MNAVIQALKLFDQSYAVGKPDLTDAQYDRLRDVAKSLWPKDLYWRTVGAKLPKGPGRIEAVLPVRMTSLEKKRPDEAMAWIAKCTKDAEFLLSPKLDGLSTLLHYKNGILQKAYTRGEDGVKGQVIQNIRHIQGALPVISRNSRFAPTKGDIYVRGEIICHQSIFNQKYSKTKGLGAYANARNFCTGLINRLHHNADTIKMLNDLTFVAYGMHREVDGKKIYCQNKVGEILQLGYWAFSHVLMPTRWRDDLWQKFIGNQIALLRAKDYPPQVFKPLANYWHPNKSSLSADLFNMLLKTWRNSADLDVLQDGLVIEVCQHAYRQKMGFADARPKHTFAIKAEVKDQESKIGVIKAHDIQISPRRLFKIVAVLEKPLMLQGAAVSRVTLHNMHNAVKKGCGVGAHIRVARSGEVIPYMLDVVKPVKFAPYKLCPHCQTPTKWTHNDKHIKVDLYCPNRKCPGSDIRKLRHFFNALKVDGLSKGTLVNMVKAGLDDIPKILLADKKQLSKVAGFADKKTQNMLLGLKNLVAKVSLVKLADASGAFNSQTMGLGQTILELILNKLGRKAFLTDTIDQEQIIAKLLTVLGIGPERAKLFAKKLPAFRQFFQTVSAIIKLAPEAKAGKLTGKTFAFTNFRNKDLHNLIEQHGGRVSDNFSKQVNVLFADGASDKTTKAEQYGCKIVQKADAFVYIDWLLKQ